MSKIYYRAHLSFHQNGTQSIVFEEFTVIHESKLNVFCVPSWEYPLDKVWRAQRVDCCETDLQFAKRCHIKIKRIQKKGSRFAFDNKAEAFSNLKARKVLRAGYIRSELNYLERFNREFAGVTWDDAQEKLNYRPTRLIGTPMWDDSL